MNHYQSNEYEFFSLMQRNKHRKRQNQIQPLSQKHEFETYTVPNLRSLLDRALPTLPSSQTSAASHSKISRPRINHQIHQRLQKAVTWLGTPFHKLLQSPVEIPLVYDVNHSHLQASTHSSNGTDKKIHCKVHQISNGASSKEYEYNLHLQLNGDTIETIPGILEKASDAAYAYPDHVVALDVNGPFDLTFVLMAQPLNTITSTLTRVKHRFGKKHEAGRMSVIGVKQLVTGSCLDAFVSQGVLRYTLTQPLCNQQDQFNLELVVSFYYDEMEPESAVPVSSDEDHHDDNPSLPLIERMVANEALLYCERGDYLTVYVRGHGYPTWRRYWVKLKAHCLVLFDESNKLAGRIPLGPMRAITFVSENDQDLVRMSGTTGLVLGFDRGCAKLMEPARLEEHEILEGKVYLYADNASSAACWKQVFDYYVDQRLMDDDRVNLRFMW
ncbi:hypothetical protein BJV82DRAFT_116151 [Fennellomyces sp. T-0311]|nr:hypothetical protein BJV82DRAFT_116151 [Fennellomyces sp. T-0311]